MDFTWLSEVFNAILSLFPRREIVRHTHGGVKWSLWRKPRSMRPGVRWYWPLISDIEIVVTARRPLSLEIQSLTTFDGTEVAVGGTIVFSITNILLAMSEKNYDPEMAVMEISKAAIASIIMAANYEDLVTGATEKQLTEECRKQLRRYGISVHRATLTDFTTCRSLNLIGIPAPPSEE